MADNITSPASAGTILATKQRTADQAQVQIIANGFIDGTGQPANVTPTVGLPVDLKATYTTTDPSLTNGQTNGLRGDQKGALLVNNVTAGAGDDYNNQLVRTFDVPASFSAGAPLTYQAQSLAANIKSATGSFQSVMFFNFTTSVVWLQLHNLNTTPTATSSIIKQFPVAAGSATVPGVLTLTRNTLAGISYGTLGLGFYVSTTFNSMTAATGATNFFIDVNYL